VNLRQRQPRQLDAEYLKWLRAQRCACGCLKTPCDAAHLRSSSLRYDKPLSGIGMKPDDKWAIPLFHGCHMAQHYSRFGEIGWWKSKGISDPFALAQAYHQRYREETFGKAGEARPGRAGRGADRSGKAG